MIDKESRIIEFLDKMKSEYPKMLVYNRFIVEDGDNKLYLSLGGSVKKFKISRFFTDYVFSVLCERIRARFAYVSEGLLRQNNLRSKVR